MRFRREPYGPAHVLYLAAAGAAGWALLLAATAILGWHSGVGGQVDPASVLLFLGFCLLARALSFEIVQGATTSQGRAISLDSAFYIAALWTQGPLVAAWVAAIVLFAHGSWRALRRRRDETLDRRPARLEILQVLYAAGAVGAQFLVVGWIVPLDRIYDGIAASPDAAHWWVLGTIPFLTLLFLAVHYGMGTLNLWLQGHDLADLRNRLLHYGVYAECLQIPLSMAVVQVFDPARPFNVILLGTTFLFINAVFKRLALKSESLRRRVSELTTLNELGRAMSSTLHLDELLERLARSSLAVLERASVLAIGLWEEKADLYRFRIFGRGESKPIMKEIARGEGLSGWVVRHRIPLLVRDLAVEGHRFAVRAEDRDKDVRSWLGVPLVVYDEVVGVLSVQSPDRGAFGEDEKRLVESIGQQAAVAIENARLYELATLDGLTQLYVRRYFDHRLDEEWRRSARYHTSYAIVLVDLDDFKALNDRFGHQVGDRVLRDTAGIIKRKMRAIDIPARYGGEEFAILLPRATTADALHVAHRIRSDIAAYRLPLDGEEVRLTASVGVASYPECGDVQAMEVLHRADLALYQAKEAGKNRVCVYRADERERVKAL